MLKTRLFVAVFLFCLAGVSPASAQRLLHIVYDDGRTAEDVDVWQTEPGSDAFYLRAHDVARVFKATQFWNASSRKTVLGVGGTRLTLTVDTRVVVVDGEPVMLRNPIRYENGFVMIPLEFVLEVAAPYTPSIFEWDPLSRTLRVARVGYNVTGIEFAVTPDRSKATITLTEQLVHHVDPSTPGLVRLKLYGGRVDPGRFDVHEPHGLFNGVRAEQTERDAFVYFDVKKAASRILVERGDNPPRIVVVLEKGDLPEIPNADFAGSKRIEVIDRHATERRELAVDRVVIDPGHGGKDNGKMGRTGLLEKDVNLLIATEVGRRLERELGVEVVLTREDDRLLSLTRRTEIANEADGDLFISIHCNSWFSSHTGGFEAYFLSPARTEQDRAVALAENAAGEVSGDGTDAAGDIEFILWDMVQNEFINESSYFAELIQKAMSTRLGIRNRGVKQANFTVLQGARMPAVLIETAFLSNAQEESLLASREFRGKVADGIVEAVIKFRQRYQ